jgi:serine/threonine protein kinase/Tfp pilus assembly protein PilF
MHGPGFTGSSMVGCMPRKWESAQSLFEAALQQAPEQRAAFLQTSCSDDAMREEVSELLANAHEADVGHFLITSPAGPGPARSSIPSAETRGPLKSSGDVLANRFRVVQFIARGGMGEVYEAEDLELHEHVAIKMVRPEIAVWYPNCLQRFKREVHLAKQVTHPNVCRVFDLFRHSDGNSAGRDSELIFVSMELLRGETLSERLRRGAANPQEALDVVTQVTAALDAAHGVGVLHRDLKPGNIFLVSAEGKKSSRVVVTDFGLAMALYEGGDDSLTPITQGEFLGTPAYMSPEQFHGQELTPASDIYSLGLVMYQMVTGVRPFEDESPYYIGTRRFADKIPSPRTIAPDLHKVWDTVILKCLDREPSRRFQVAGQVLSALQSDSTPHRFVPKARRNSIAILPFVNISGNPEMEYLSDGITETIISTLSRIPKMRVMAHSTVFRFKGRLDDPQSIGRQLDVASVLVGRVSNRGNLLKIGVELVDVGNGRQVWGEQYNRNFGDVFEVQDDIASEISTKLEVKLTNEEKKNLYKRQTQNTDAYQLYLKGRFFWNKRTKDDIQTSIEFFTRAVAADRSYALAYSGLADSYTTQAFLCPHIPPHELMPQARRAAAKALSLDEGLSEAQASTGIIDLRYDWNTGSAERCFQRAIALKPSYSIAHQWYGECLSAMADFDQAITQLKIALDLDPLSLTINSVLGGMLCFGRQYDQSIEQCCSTLDMHKDFWLALYFLGLAYECRGETSESIVAFQHATTAAERNPMVLAGLGHAYAKAGKTSEAMGLLEELRALSRRSYTSPVNLALVALGLGDFDLAFSELDRAVDARAGWLVFLRADPRFDTIQSDSRFATLLHRVFVHPPEKRSIG